MTIQLHLIVRRLGLMVAFSLAMAGFTGQALASEQSRTLGQDGTIYSDDIGAHPRKTQVMLVQRLSELKENSPTDLKIDTCLETLITAYEADDQIEYAAQCWKARAKFVRLNEPGKYGNTLEKYALFLIDHKMLKPAALVADELTTVAFQPNQTTTPNQLDWVKIAEGLAAIDADESYKIYKIAFDYYTHDAEAMRSCAYGTTAISWASLLAKHGKRQEAISVLQSALDFSRHSQDYTYLWMRKSLYTVCIEYLSAAGLTQEAQAMTEQRRNDERESGEQQISADERQLAITLADPKAPAWVKIIELTKKAFRELDNHNCKEGLRDLNQALSFYEKYSAEDKDSMQYSCFVDVRKRLSACGQNVMGTEILWQIMEIKMKSGLDDREFPRSISCHPSTAQNADQELFPPWPTDPSRLAKDQDLEKLMVLAKQSDNPANLIFALRRQLERETVLHPQQSRLLLCEKIEEIRERANSPTKLLFAKFATALELVRQDRFSDAMEKWRSALAIKGVNTDRCTLMWSPFSYLSRTLGTALVAKNKLNDAKQVFLEAYDRSFELGDHEYNQFDLKDIRELTWKYAELKDVPSTQSLLEKALSIAAAKGEKGIMAKSDVYLALAQLDLMRNRPAEAADFFKTYELDVKEMKADLQYSMMQNGMREYARLLDAYGYHDQSTEMTAKADLAQKSETEKHTAAVAKLPAATSPLRVLQNLADSGHDN